MPLPITNLSSVAQDAHAAHLAAEDSNASAKLNLADQLMQLKKAQTLAALVTLRTKAQLETRSQLAGAALAEGLGQLNVSDPKYPQQYSSLIAKYSEGAGTDAAQAIIKSKQQEAKNFQDSQTAQAQEIFKAGLPKRIAAVSGSDAVDPTLKNQLVDPQTGGVNTDALAQAEQQMQAAKQNTDVASHMSALTTALKTLLPPDSSAPADVQQRYKDTKYNLEVALKNASYSAGPGSSTPTTATSATTPGAPAATPTATPDVNAAFQSLIGGGAATPAPAATAPSATPAATPTASTTGTSGVANIAAADNSGGGDELAEPESAA